MLSLRRGLRSFFVGLSISALLATTLVFLPSTAERAAAAPGLTISGTVSVGGALPSFVGVRAESVSGGTVLGIVDADGSYVIEGLSSASYILRFWADGYAARVYPNATRASGGEAVSLVDADVSGIDVTLDRSGSITGNMRVDDGRPLQSGTFSSVVAVPVDLSAEQPHQAEEAYFGYATANGDYAITGLAPGSYVVRSLWGCDCVAQPRFNPEYYPDSDVTTGAAPVAVQPGSTTTGIDFSLATPGSISGVTSGGVEWAEIARVGAGSGDAPWATPVTIDAGQAYSFGELAPGAYVIRFGVGEGVSKWWRSGASQESAEQIIVSAGQNVVDIDLSLTPIEMTTAVPVVSGTPSVGSSLTAAPGTWTTGAVLGYQWLADGVTLTGATGASLVVSSALVGKSLSVRVTGVKSGYATAARTSVATAKVATAGNPVISGTAITGSTLTAVPGVWTASTAFAYQWFAGGVAINGATGSSFVVTSAQAGKAVTVRVTGSKAGFATIAKTSAATLSVAWASVPVLTGTPAVGSTLTATPGSWTTGSTFGYQWFADGVTISGATAATYVLTAAQAGKSVTARVTGARAGFPTIVKASAATAKVATAGTPSISGSAVTGSTLTAAPGTWTASTAYAYQWFAGGVAIAGANRSTLQVTSAVAAKALTVRVTGSKAGFATVAKTSAATLQVAWASVPVVSGSPAVGSTLTAVPGSWTTAASLTYQWFADGVAISGATGPTHVVAAAQAGKKISVRVTGSRPSFTTVVRTSADSGKVATAGTPSISGSAVTGSTLTAAPGVWTASTALAYQWLAGGVAISGATSSKLLVTSAMVSKALTVRVTGSKATFATVAKTSAATPLVAWASVPAVSGTAGVGSTLTAMPGSWTTGTAFAYQWFADGVAIGGATQAAHVVTTAQAKKAVSVRVTGTRAGYATVVRTSLSRVVQSAKGDGTKSCPAWAPIKGNASSGIYHVPGGGSYDRTIPEECFSTEAAAVAAGYRKAKN